MTGRTEITADFGRIATALGMLASVIKSGENWSDECERAKNEAFDALGRIGGALATPPASGSPAGLDKVLCEALENYIDKHPCQHSCGERTHCLCPEGTARRALCTFTVAPAGAPEGWRQGIEAAAKINDVRAEHARSSAEQAPEFGEARACLFALAESHETTAKLIRDLSAAPSPPVPAQDAGVEAMQALEPFVAALDREDKARADEGCPFPARNDQVVDASFGITVGDLRVARKAREALSRHAPAPTKLGGNPIADRYLSVLREIRAVALRGTPAWQLAHDALSKPWPPDDAPAPGQAGEDALDLGCCHDGNPLANSDWRKVSDCLDWIIESHPDKAAQALAKAPLIGWFVGQTMKALSGEPDAELVSILAREKLLAAQPRPSDVREATTEMLTAGARSIGNTMGQDSHDARAQACWNAMWSARDGKMEPKPSALQSPATSGEGGRE